MIEEFKSIDDPAELTAWKKAYNENVVVPMMDEARSVESAAQGMSAIDLHRSNQWGKNKMAGELDKLRVKNKQKQLEAWDYRQERFESGKGLAPEGPRPEDPDVETLIGDFG